MITSGILATFLVTTVVNKSHESEVATLEYYQNLIGNFLQNASTWDYPKDYRQYFEDVNSEPELWGDFDFIIVGTGTAGSVLTNRLTESGKFKVLVLEAGGQENDFTDIPAFAGYLMRSDFNWGLRTIPQTTACLGMKEQRCNFPRGKVVGGSSTINFMVYSRGNRDDFNEWEALGNPGWNYENVLPYFRKSENSILLEEDCKYHGHEGSLNVERTNFNIELTNVFLKACKELGWKKVDYNGENQTGYSFMQSTTINGRRCSGAKAFIKPVLNRSNLQLLDRSFVLKVLFQDNKARGVEFIRNGKKYQASASKEVILSAGAINTPQLLMLSGIGPREHLEELGIPVRMNLAVGSSLADHQVYTALQFTTNISIEEPNIVELLKDYLQGQGALTSAAAMTGIAFSNTRYRSKSNPNLEYLLSFADPQQMHIFQTQSAQVLEENWSAIRGPSAGKLCFFIYPVLMHPYSRGSLRLQSKDPFDLPLVDLNMLSDPDNIDIEDMLNGIKDAFGLASTSAFQSIDSKYLCEPLPPCKNFEHLSDDYWRCAIRQLTTTVYHPVTTCKMGPPHDRTAVVNEKLKVYGTESLRVIDAGVMPFSTASHTNAVTYMIGEKGADIIREEYED